MKKAVLFSLFIGLAVGLMSFATPEKNKLQKHKWEKLGQKVVNIKGDHDVIPVTIKEGTFKALKFKVLKAPIHLLNIKVHYANGTVDNFKINKRFPKGSESRVLDLPGNKRIIKKITFNYKTIPNGNGRALVVAWGRH